MLGSWCYGVAEIFSDYLTRTAAATIFATPPQATYQEALSYFLKAEEIQEFLFNFFGDTHAAEFCDANCMSFLKDTNVCVVRLHYSCSELTLLYRHHFTILTLLLRCVQPGFWLSNWLNIAKCYKQLKDKDETNKWLTKLVSVSEGKIVTEEDKKVVAEAKTLLGK